MAKKKKATGGIEPTFNPEDAAKIKAAFREVTGEELTAASLAQLGATPLFARPGEETSMPKGQLGFVPETPEVAYQVVHDMLMLDGNARQNLATFVTTWMDDHANKLFAETFDKNMIDKDEYPMTADIEERCVNIISELWNAPGAATGTSTVGSSEAVMLGGMALKWRWRRSRSRSAHTRPR